MAYAWMCSGASLGRSLASLKTPVPAKKMQLLWQKAILETMMLIQMNRETQPCMHHCCLLMFSYTVNTYIFHNFLTNISRSCILPLPRQWFTIKIRL